MQRAILEARFFETYYFANVIRNVLSNQFDFLRNLDEFYGDDNYLGFACPFPRYSALHSFIEFIVHQLLTDIDGVDLKGRQETVQRFASIPAALSPHPSCLPINEALDYYGISHITFCEWLAERSVGFGSATDDDVDDYYRDLQDEGPCDNLLDKAVHEVFYVLFQNRRLLLLFNDMMACQMAKAELESIPTEFSSYFARSGVLQRAAIPMWVQRAVFFRDRGLCVLCHCDLSGCLSIGNLENFDHIVPLGKGGLNDVTNIQLLCRQCNSRKRDRGARTSDLYEAWYPMSGEEKRSI